MLIYSENGQDTDTITFSLDETTVPVSPLWQGASDQKGPNNSPENIAKGPNKITTSTQLTSIGVPEI